MNNLFTSKENLLSRRDISYKNKQILLNILSRSNLTDFCPICDEIINSIATEEIVENTELREIKDRLDNLPIQTSSDLKQYIEDNAYDIIQSYLEETEEKLNILKDSIEDIDYINKVSNNMSKIAKEINTKFDTLTNSIKSLVEYIDTKKTINLRKDENNKGIILVKEIVSKFEKIK